MIFPRGAGGEPFFELAPTVFAQCPNQGLRKRDGPLGSACLGLMQRELAIHPLQRSPNGESAAVEVDIGPLQSQCLTSTQSDPQRDGP